MDAERREAGGEGAEELGRGSQPGLVKDRRGTLMFRHGARAFTSAAKLARRAGGRVLSGGHTCSIWAAWLS